MSCRENEPEDAGGGAGERQEGPRIKPHLKLDLNAQ